MNGCTRNCSWRVGKSEFTLTSSGRPHRFIGVHPIDEQVRPIESEVRGIDGALQKVADALVNATR